MMEGNTELLNYIHQNCQMGIETLSQLIDIVEDDKFSQQLSSQLGEYKSVDELVSNKLNVLGEIEKGISNMTILSTYMSIGLKTLTNSTPSHISEMLIQGSTMGIIDITKNMNKYANADKSILKLADCLLSIEQCNIECLKEYLC